MMREFGNDPNTSTANIAGVRPDLNELPRTVRLDQPIREEARGEAGNGMRPFNTEADDDGSNNIAKIVGGVVVGLMILGGGIYAYEMSSRSTLPSQQVALKTPTQNSAAANQTASAPPPAATPENSAPDNSVAPTPAAPRHRVVKSADSDSNAVAPANDTASVAVAPQQSAAADPAINAPMTLTPDNAPAPEQSGAQTAMQQPLTAPNVSGQASQPTASVADNAPHTLAPQLQAPSDQPASDAAPAQQTPQAQLPAAPAQDSAAQ